MTTIKFHVKGFIVLAAFLAGFLAPVWAGVSFLAIVRITFGG